MCRSAAEVSEATRTLPVSRNSCRKWQRFNFFPFTLSRTGNMCVSVCSHCFPTGTRETELRWTESVDFQMQTQDGIEGIFIVLFLLNDSYTPVLHALHDSRSHTSIPRIRNCHSNSRQRQSAETCAGWLKRNKTNKNKIVTPCFSDFVIVIQ